MPKNPTYIVGIDEAGRGPIAGPVAVGVVVIPKDFDWQQLVGVADSKQLAPKKRDALFRRAKELKRAGKLNFAVSMVSAKVIDRIGIVPAIETAVSRSIRRLTLSPHNCFIQLDGALRAPSQFAQETIIKGDQKEKIIGLASICAKETRDAYMKRVATRYPEYGFAKHMGYGTESHRKAVKAYGLSNQHRKTYCKSCF